MYNNAKVQAYEGGAVYTLVQSVAYPHMYKCTWDKADCSPAFQKYETDYSYDEDWITNAVEGGTWTVVTAASTHTKIRVNTGLYEYQGLYCGIVVECAEIIDGLAHFKHNGKKWVLEEGDFQVVEEGKQQTEEYTGSSSNYYKVYVKNPTTLDAPYEAECNDIIEALKMTFAEGNAFKAIWRKAKARQGVKKKGYDNGVYDSEKVVFFGERMLVEAKENETIS